MPVNVSFKANAELVRQIDQIAERDLRSRSGTILMALRMYIENHKKMENSYKTRTSGRKRKASAEITA